MRTGGDIGNDSGVIMADALVGVVIVSLVIAVCLTSLKITRSFLRTAQEARDAGRVLAGAVDTVPRLAGHYAGQAGTTIYVVDVSEEADRGVRLCRMTAYARSAHGRSYRLVATRWCAPEAA